MEQDDFRAEVVEHFEAQWAPPPERTDVKNARRLLAEAVIQHRFFQAVIRATWHRLETCGNGLDEDFAAHIAAEVTKRILKGQIRYSPKLNKTRGYWFTLADRLGREWFGKQARLLANEDLAAQRQTDSQLSQLRDAVRQRGESPSDDLLAELHAAIAKLDAPIRAVILHYLHVSTSVREIEAALRIPKSTVHRHLCDGFERLRQTLGAR